MISRVIEKRSYYDVDLDLIRSFIREYDDDVAPDQFLQTLSESAFSWIEQYTNRQLSKTMVELTLDNPPNGYFFLPYGEIISVNSVLDSNIKSIPYMYDSSSERIAITASGYRLPVKVRYECGYLAYTSIPQAIQQAHLMLIATMYQQREDQSPLTMSNVNFNIKSLLNPFRYHPV
ncbi:hypothetical protein [Shewanella sp. SE1]|uniref:hypothetical protein n=1 Tax=Shewanella sp. SE1 TaxID=2705014 RepID=UPI00138EFB1F|nr:hypothetical protein [Shewanella sp. SE1]NDO73068.1 hypothetical protein [Shewanella sp. SE1]